jgi:hypothetical protein
MCAIDGIKSYHVKTNLEETNLKINGMHFRLNQHNGYTLNGSLHRFHNHGLHNADNYCLSQLKQTINSLFDNFNINPDITPINGFEFGVNIKLSHNPNYLIQRIILHKSNTGSSKAYFKEFEYKNYAIKIYNKSELTAVEPFHSDNILRIEVKVKKMRYIQKQGVYCKVLSDFLGGTIMEQLEKILINIIDECLIIDFADNQVECLSDKDKIIYLQYINPSYWITLHQNRRAYFREKERCTKFIEKHSNSNLKIELKNLIREKCNELRDFAVTNNITESWDKITNLQTNKADKITTCGICAKISKEDKNTVSQINGNITQADKITTFENENKRAKKDKITIKINSDSVPLITSENISIKYCKTCGRVISNPMPRQKFCSPKEVGEQAAHKCRNADSNPRNKTKYMFYKINSHQTLFDVVDYVRTERKIYLTQ